MSSRNRQADADSTPHPNDVRAELRRIAISHTFAKSHRCCALLDHLVRDASNQKYQNTVVAVNRPDRTRSGMTLGTHLAAAVQMARLRNRLSDYYESEGRANPLRISVPDDGYQVSIDVVESARAARPADYATFGQ